MSNNNLRTVGASDKFFYYTASGKGLTMDLRIHLCFKKPADMDKLKTAAEKALEFFPEYSVRPVIKNGVLYYEENHSPVKVFNNTERVNFGSDETNGHLFCFMNDGNNTKDVIFSVYHGVSDWVGTNRFMRTILYNYAGIALSDEEIEKSGIRVKFPENWDNKENLDPYNYYGRKDVEPLFVPDTSNFFMLPVDFYEPHATYSHHFRFTLKVSEFLTATKSLHTSFMPLLIAISDLVIKESYDVQDQNILMALPVNLRTVYGSNCAANFSDAVLLTMTAKELSMTPTEICASLRTKMNEQRKPENYSQFLYNKAQTVVDFESAPEGIIEKARLLTEKSPGGVTFGTTYLGILDLPGALNDIMENIFLDSPFGMSFFLVSTFGDEMSVTLDQRFDDETLVKGMYKKLETLGFHITLTDRGRITQNTLDLTKIKKV